MLKAIAIIGWLALVINEVRGLVLAAPIIYALYQSGGTLMAWWLAFCALAGIALSVIVPAYVAKRVGEKLKCAE